MMRRLATPFPAPAQYGVPDSPFAVDGPPDLLACPFPDQSIDEVVRYFILINLVTAQGGVIQCTAGWGRCRVIEFPVIQTVPIAIALKATAVGAYAGPIPVVR